MRYAIVSSALVVGASAHGLLTSVTGANGVTMPGLSVTDGTPRDCSTNGCGSQADTSILRDREMKDMPLGRTQGNGKVDAASAIANFMGTGKSTQSNKGSKGVGQEDDLSGLNKIRQKRLAERDLFIRGLLDGLLGGLGGGGGKGGAKAAGQKNNFAVENSVADSAGIGADKGLPTTDNQGNFNVVYRQINQDGAGPLEMECDATSCGTDNNAFQSGDIQNNVPGAILGLSLATNTEFAMNCSLPQGMVCKASCGGAQNVCVCRMRNNTPAGPFGGSVAVTQSSNAVKRAVAYRLRKRYEILRREKGTKKTADKDIETNSLERRFELASEQSAQELADADNEEELSDEAEAKVQKRFELAPEQSAEELAAADNEEKLSDEAEAKVQKRFEIASKQSPQEDREADEEEALSDGA
ncbi:cell surface protein (Mas1) [Ophiocordyceps camponoti-floridani]|uniref:Cell surface protein (Mas1) n=1 Tax=Ophiocordyceps camponoti-floridani TaxID=2030778 RepID=A0A8H4QAI7_9HYPO|nr:cell surface protein (Mas1) [Ophiocordyceps camponoti-floridani]